MKKSEYKIIDSFLSKEEHDNIKCVLFGSQSLFPWGYCPSVTYLSDTKNSNYYDNYYFNHVFFKSSSGEYMASNFMPILKPLLEKIKIPFDKLLRIKANMFSRTDKLIEHSFHVDYDYPHRGIIYYVNDNDGYTMLNDGTKIASVGNRVLFFNSALQHCSTNCTNEKVRVNININYND